jgi:SHS2 domain-containing protein
MPYEYIEDIAISDVAFRAWDNSLEGLFVAAGDATTNVMVDPLNSIEERATVPIRVSEDSIDMLLFNFLQELIYYKDAEELLLRVREVEIWKEGDRYLLSAQAKGEKLDVKKHHLEVDVKAVTLHRFRVEQAGDAWNATVVLDI